MVTMKQPEVRRRRSGRGRKVVVRRTTRQVVDMPKHEPTFGPYRLGGVIAVDAASTLYRATIDTGPTLMYRGVEQRSTTDIALRVYRDLGDDATEVTRVVEDKVRRVAPMRHRAIAAIHDVGTHSGRLYIATRLAGHRTLRDVLDEGGAWGRSSARALLAPLAEALDDLADAGVVHGALGPTTIMIDADGGTAVLTGLGHHEVLHRPGAPKLSGDTVDDTLYVAPEQLRGEPSTDRTDQYSLACALLHLTTGRPPYTATTVRKLYGAHLLARPPTMDPDARTDAVSVAMAKRPEERHRSSVAMLSAIGDGSPTRIASPPTADDRLVRPSTPPRTEPSLHPRSSAIATVTGALGRRGVGMLVLVPVLVLVIAAIAWATVDRGRSAVAGGPAVTPTDAPAAAPGVVPASSSAPVTQLDPSATVIRLRGSTTIGDQLAPALATAFLEAQDAADVRATPGTGPDATMVTGTLPGTDGAVAIDIAAEGTGTGFDALAAADTDIAMASRPVSEDEQDQLRAIGDMTSIASEHVIGVDGIAIIVNNQRSVGRLSLSELHDIYTCEITNWKQVGGPDRPIALHARDAESGTYDLFADTVLADDALCDGAQRFADNGLLSRAVSQDPDGIGFVGLPFVGSNTAVPLTAGAGTALKPSLLTVATENYALSRRLYLYTEPNPDEPLVSRFVEFALSDAGQQVVSDAGFVGQALNEQAVARAQEQVAASIPDDAPKDYVEYIEGARRVPVDIRFESGSEQLDTKAVRDIDRLTRLMSRGEFRDERIRLAGFTDDRGDDSTNEALSEARAAAVAERLEANGVPVAAVEGFGKALPVSDDGDAAARTRSRRVEVYVR